MLDGGKLQISIRSVCPHGPATISEDCLMKTTWDKHLAERSSHNKYVLVMRTDTSINPCLKIFYCWPLFQLTDFQSPQAKIQELCDRLTPQVVLIEQMQQTEPTGAPDHGSTMRKARGCLVLTMTRSETFSAWPVPEVTYPISLLTDKEEDGTSYLWEKFGHQVSLNRKTLEIQDKAAKWENLYTPIRHHYLRVYCTSSIRLKTTSA